MKIKHSGQKQVNLHAMPELWVREIPLAICNAGEPFQRRVFMNPDVVITRKKIPAWKSPTLN